MKNTIGSYVWHYVSNGEEIKGLEGNHRYIVCVENPTPKGSEWHLIMAHWYEEGDELSLKEPNGNAHIHKIKKTGFYIVNDAGKDRFTSIYRVFGVRYWTEIKSPEINPEEILTIESSSN